MTINDPIADMLTRVRNANSAGKATVSMPSSKKLVEIARIMTEEGYVQGYEIIENSPRDILEITMKYGEKAKTIRGIKRISKPGLRIYAGKDELPRVLGGLGTAIVSTSKGVMARPRRSQRLASAAKLSHTSGKERIGAYLCLVSANSPFRFLPELPLPSKVTKSPRRAPRVNFLTSSIP